MIACAGCGLAVPRGTGGCRAMFDELAVRQWSSPVAYPVRRMMVDTYALQHPDEFCVSAKSLAAHLTGLCAVLEYPSHPTLLQVLRRWLDGPSPVAKPDLLAARGALTIAEAYGAPDAERLVSAADRWARDVWKAYAPLHPLARRWVEQALAGPVR